MKEKLTILNAFVHEVATGVDVIPPVRRHTTSGFRQRRPAKRAKSASFECTSHWCSIARAAMCASVVRPTPA
jgi:hypothetical protein